MADTTTMVLSIYSVLVSWTYILLVILIIAKIIQFVSGGSFLSGWGKNDSGRDGHHRIGGDGDGKGKKGKGEEDEEAKEKEGLNVAEPGFAKVLVVDEDDNPIQGADVTIVPARMWKRHWGFLKTKKKWRNYGGVTGPDGTWPSRGQYATIGSGTVKIRVTHIDWVASLLWSLSFNEAFGNQDQVTDFEIQKGEHHDIVVGMIRKGEKAELFEPSILEVRNVDDKTISVKGIIK